jgi:hypothetical protein
MTETRVATSLFFVLLAAPTIRGAGDPPIDDVLRASLGRIAPSVRAHVEFLADDLLEGRKPGTRGYDLAARYVASQLAALGVSPAGEGGTYFQAVPLLESRLTLGTVSVLAPSGTPVGLVYREDFLMSGNLLRTESHVEAPVVFVGFGVTAPEQGHDDYAKVDVKGKIVAILRGAPARFPSEQRAHFSSSRLKAQNAARHGAVGILAFATPEGEKVYPFERVVQGFQGTAVDWMHPDGRPEGAVPEIRVGAILSPAGARKLFAASPVTLEKVFERAAAGRPQAFLLGVSVALVSRSEHRRLQSANVVGRLAGSDEALANTSVVLSAHLDHEGVGAEVNGDTIYNGAYDNAAGTAVVLEVARVLAGLEKAPKRSVLFLFVTAEEDGLLGSDYFAQRPVKDAGTMVANVNIDMPLFLFPLADLVAFGSENSTLDRPTARAAECAGLALGPDPWPEQTIFIRSDQYSFVRQGIPAVFLVTGTRSADPAVDGSAALGDFLAQHYHQPSDDLRLAMNPDAISSFVRASVLLTHALAQDPEAPRWKPGNFFGRTFGRQSGPKRGQASN